MITLVLRMICTCLNPRCLPGYFQGGWATPHRDGEGPAPETIATHAFLKMLKNMQIDMINKDAITHSHLRREGHKSWRPGATTEYRNKISGKNSDQLEQVALKRENSSNA